MATMVDATVADRGTIMARTTTAIGILLAASVAAVADITLDAVREPDFSKIPHGDETMPGSAVVDGWTVRKAFLSSGETNAIGFTADAGETSLLSTNFTGIGRIYFKARSVSPSVDHVLLVQSGRSCDGPWETLNRVSFPTPYICYYQFCIEVNDSGLDGNGNPDPKIVRIVRETPGVDAADYIFLHDLVVTPAANVAASIPSVLHPGYPSKDDPVTISLAVTSLYDDHPADNLRVTMRHRRTFGSVVGEWATTPLSSSNGADFSVTLPPMPSGRFEYYFEVDFTGDSYRYKYYRYPYPYDEPMPLRFYYAGNDQYRTTDPRNGNEVCNPLYVFAAEPNPPEFSRATGSRSRVAPAEDENRFLWFRVRAYPSRHDHLRIVYSNRLETVSGGVGPVVHTNAFQLIGDNLWQSTIPVTNSVRLFATVEGVAPYGGAGTTEYLPDSTVWGDDDQKTIRPPFAGHSETGSPQPLEIALVTADAATLAVRFDANTGSYQVRRATCQDFSGWIADESRFEDSVGFAGLETYAEAFDESALFPETTFEPVTTTFDNDTVGDYTQEDYFTTCGWRLHEGTILREISPRSRYDLLGNVAALIGSSGGYLQNESGSGAIPEGLEYVRMRVRPTFGGDGHTPYDRTGFAWANYFLAVSNLQVSAISDGNPYVQVMAAYRDPDDYVALRLTQTAMIGEKTGMVPHVRQDLIRVVNGVETVLATTFTRKWNNGKGYANNRIESDGNNIQILLTAYESSWIVEIDMTTEGTVRARAWIPNTTSPINWLTGSAETTGTVSCDAFDAVANFRNFHVVVDGTSSNLDTSTWYLGGMQSGDGTQSRWKLAMPVGRVGPQMGVERPVPALSYTVGIGKAGTDVTLPPGATFETPTTNTVSTTSMGYAEATETVHCLGNTFVRIQPLLSDADLVVDDVEVKPWHGLDLPEGDSVDDRSWQARQAVVVRRNGSRMLALTTSRANPAVRQMVSTPAMTNGIGPISFNYEVEGGTVAFVVERNAVTGAYGDDDEYLAVGDEIIVNAGQSGEIYRNLHEDMTGKVRVRILPERSDPDATLYLDNFFAKGCPPDDGRFWTAYNALIVAPTRNAAVDGKQFEEDVSTQTAFLNNAVDQDTHPGMSYPGHLPYIQSPVIGTGLGGIAFWYRVWDSGNPVPGKLTLWVAEKVDDPDSEWRKITEDDLVKPQGDPGDPVHADKWAAYGEQVAAFQELSSITNGDYRYFSAEIRDATNFVLRICSDTNGTQRVAIDNVIVTEPLGASLPGTDQTHSTPVPVPHDWLEENAGTLLREFGNYEDAANAMAGNGVNAVWQCYVAGLDPLNGTNRFEATIAFTNGSPVVSWIPRLSAEEEERRVYTVKGKKTLSDPEWSDVPQGTEPGYGFFIVTVEMK